MLLILLLSFLILACFRMPVALALGMAAVVSILSRSDIPLAAIPHKMVNGIDSYVFIAIPLFLLAGRLMNAGGITDRIFRFARVIVGHISGGLAHANVVASVIFSWMSGSACRRRDASMRFSFLICLCKAAIFSSTPSSGRPLLAFR